MYFQARSYSLVKGKIVHLSFSSLGRGSTLRHPHPSPVTATQAGELDRPEVELQVGQRQLHPPLPRQLQQGRVRLRLPARHEVVS